jgi:hypothetical protein
MQFLGSPISVIPSVAEEGVANVRMDTSSLFDRTANRGERPYLGRRIGDGRVAWRPTRPRAPTGPASAARAASTAARLVSRPVVGPRRIPTVAAAARRAVRSTARRTMPFHRCGTPSHDPSVATTSDITCETQPAASLSARRARGKGIRFPRGRPSAGSILFRQGFVFEMRDMPDPVNLLSS